MGLRFGLGCGLGGLDDFGLDNFELGWVGLLGMMVDLKFTHVLRVHFCLILPKPPNFAMSRQNLHVPQFAARQPGHDPQEIFLFFFSYSSLRRKSLFIWVGGEGGGVGGGG